MEGSAAAAHLARACLLACSPARLPSPPRLGRFALAAQKQNLAHREMNQTQFRFAPLSLALSLSLSLVRQLVARAARNVGAMRELQYRRKPGRHTHTHESAGKD